MSAKETEHLKISKTEETDILIEYVTKLTEDGIKINNTIFLADIAKSLAMIADKLCDKK